MSWETTHINNKLRVSSMPYLYDIAEGNVADHYALRVFGHNDTQTTNNVVVNPLGTAKKYLSAAGTVKVMSGNSSDSSAGNGARTVFIQGQNGSFEIVSTTLTLSGTTAVESSQQFFRV